MHVAGYELRHKLLERFGHFFDDGYLMLFGRPCYFARPIYMPNSSAVDYWEYNNEPLYSINPVTQKEIMEVHEIDDHDAQLLRLDFWGPAFGEPVEGQIVAHNLAADNINNNSEWWQRSDISNITGDSVYSSGHSRYQKVTRTTMYDTDGNPRIHLSMKGALDEDVEADLILRRGYVENESAFTLFRFSVRLW